MMTHYATYDVMSCIGKTKIETEISHQQCFAALKYSRTCITVLKVPSHNAINIFISVPLGSVHINFKSSRFGFK